jgi:hypothetical protein
LDSNFLLKTKDKFNHYALVDFNSVLEKENYSKKVLDFKADINAGIANHLKSNFNSTTILRNKEELLRVVSEKNIKNVVMPYITCGYENDFIGKIKNEIKITYLARDYDQYCFQFSNKGFFAFKEQIPKILSKFL